MDWIEVTARTVDDAKELALDRLGVVEDELEFEVVDEAARACSAIGRGDARIRARVKPISREKPSDRKRRGRRPNERSQRGGQGGGGRERAAAVEGRRPAGGRPADRPARAPRPSPAPRREPTTHERERCRPSRRAVTGSRQSGRRRRRGGRGRGSGGGGGHAAAARTVRSRRTGR